MPDTGLARLAFLMKSKLSLALVELSDSLVSPCWASPFWQSPGWPAPPKGTKKSCPLHPAPATLGFVTRFARPSGQPAAVTPLRSVSLHRRSRGRLIRAIPWPFKRGRPVLSPHPCGSTPYATIPLTLLMGRLESPDSLCIEQKAIILDLHDLPGDSDSVPVRRPSGGVAQGDARHGRRARNEGTGTSLRDGPRSGTGRRGPRRSRGRMSGGLLFGSFFLAKQEKGTRPAGRNQKYQHTR